MKGYLTYGSGLLIEVEAGQWIDVYAMPKGEPPQLLGTYKYADLDVISPPRGVRIMG